MAKTQYRCPNTNNNNNSPYKNVLLHTRREKPEAPPTFMHLKSEEQNIQWPKHWIVSLNINAVRYSAKIQQQQKQFL